MENTTELSVTALRIYTDHLPQEGGEQFEVLRGGEAELPVIAPGRYVRRPPGGIEACGAGHGHPQITPPPPKNPERSPETSGSTVPKGARYLSQGGPSGLSVGDPNI